MIKAVTFQQVLLASPSVIGIWSHLRREFAIEPDNRGFIDRVAEELCRRDKICGRCFRVDKIFVGVKLNTDYPAYEILGKLFNVVLGCKNWNTVMNEWYEAYTIFQLGKSYH